MTLVDGDRAAQQPSHRRVGLHCQDPPGGARGHRGGEAEQPQVRRDVPDRVTAADLLGGKPYQRRVDPRHAAPEIAQPPSEDT